MAACHIAMPISRGALKKKKNLKKREDIAVRNPFNEVSLKNSTSAEFSLSTFAALFFPLVGKTYCNCGKIHLPMKRC